MVVKQQILTSIRKLHRQFGRTPTLYQFLSDTGITEYAVSQSFPKWNDAIRAAGLQPYARNLRVEDSELLRDWGETARRKGAIPEHRTYRREGKYDPRTIDRRFGSWSKVPAAFRNFAEGKREWADVLELLPARVRRRGLGESRRRRAKGGVRTTVPWYARRRDLRVYGNPTEFRWLRHEPVNEQGVVLLFGMLAEKLGYMVESVHKAFPDCEAKRQVAADRWQRVRIEFEFESKNYRDHGHPPQGCDVIVCWRHNWPDHPKHIEILELSSVIASLSGEEV